MGLIEWVPVEQLKGKVMSSKSVFGALQGGFTVANATDPRQKHYQNTSRVDCNDRNRTA